MFNSVLNKHAPLQKLSRKQKKLNGKPWLSKGILISIKTKHKLLQNMIKTKMEKHKKQYQKYRNKLTHIIEQAKKKHFTNQVEQSQHNSRLLWKTVNDIIKLKKTKSSHHIRLKDENKNLIENPVHVSNIFNKYFSSIGTNMANKINPTKNTKTTPTSLISTTINSFFLQPISVEEVLHELRNLDPSKSTRSDNPPVKYIKLAAGVIAPTLTNLFNHCITTSTFPKSLKISEIIPLFKQGDIYSCNNYRPISLISIFSKIFEKCIYKQLVSYFNKNNVFYKSQFGFRENYSTELAVAQVCNEIIENLENNDITCSIFLDLAKAFDTVDHKILLDKLHKYGIRGEPHKLLANYLNNRQQCTIINKIKSDQCENNYGVPQGSTLGPLLFLIYINDLPNASNLKVTLFADDAILTCIDKNPNTLQHKTNAELKKIEDWMKTNKLTINYKKTNYMIITKRKINKSLLKIKIGQNEIIQKDSVKYLGIIIDNKMNWTQHINYLNAKLCKGSWVISKLKKYVNINTLKIIYYSLIYSHLKYCVTSWGKAAKTIIQPIINTQKRVIRIMTGSNCQTNSSPLFTQLQILKLCDIYKLQMAITIHNLKNNIWQINNTNYQLSNLNTIHKYNTRISKNSNYYVHSIRTNLGKSSIMFAGPQVWQDVPNAIKNYPKHTFKKAYKKFLLQSYK